VVTPTTKETVMEERRLVGIDLGIASAHTVRVLDESGATIAKRKAVPTVASLTAIEEVALAGCAGVRLEVVMEPTGPAWLPIAVFFASRGHVVYRVSSAKASDLRKFLSRHTKTNGIDADTLARLPLIAPAGLLEVWLPDAAQAALDRRVRVTDRLTREAAERKVRIKDLTRQLFPMTPLTTELRLADVAVLERWANPNVLVKVGIKRVTKVIGDASRGQLGEERAQEWMDAAHAAIELYGAHPAIAFEDLAAEVATEVRLLQEIQRELATHAAEREVAYRWVDPQRLTRSLPGLAEIGGPAVTAIMGDAARFPTAKAFRAFTGLTPRTSETGESDRKGQPMSKAGSSLLRTTFVRAAETARHQDPQLARIYYVQMVERGKNHLGALCVVAAALSERTWAVRRRGMPYVICDIDGRAIDATEAKAIIAERFTVTDEVRARRRNKKAANTTPMGKVPQTSHTDSSRSRPKRGQTGRPSPSGIVPGQNRRGQPQPLTPQPA
jgi:transposase